jgi:hypothetical protein
MKGAWTIPLILLLGSCSVAPSKPSSLIGSWKATELSRGNFHAPLGSPYKIVFEAADGENLFDVTVIECGGAENLEYSVDELHITNACGSQGKVCVSTRNACFMRRINVDVSAPPVKESCTDKLPYCGSRLAQDDELLTRVLRTVSSWHFSRTSLVLSSETANAQVTFQREDH